MTTEAPKKSIHQLKVEHDKARPLVGKSFVHKTSGESYQLLFTAFEKHSQELTAVYVLSSMPWLKFTRPYDEFMERFELGHGRGGAHEN